MLGFCFRFSLKVPGSDTSCDDGDKKGFPFRCAADRACDAGWGCRPGVRGWLGKRRCGAGWVRETGAVDARDKRKPPASETGAVDTRDKRKPPPSETGAGDARDRPKPPPSETGAGDARDRPKPPPSDETGADGGQGPAHPGRAAALPRAGEDGLPADAAAAEAPHGAAAGAGGAAPPGRHAGLPRGRDEAVAEQRMEAERPKQRRWNGVDDPVGHCLAGNSLLLTGLPGTGKTHLARTIVARRARRCTWCPRRTAPRRTWGADGRPLGAQVRARRQRAKAGLAGGGGDHAAGHGALGGPGLRGAERRREVPAAGRLPAVAGRAGLLGRAAHQRAVGAQPAGPRPGLRAPARAASRAWRGTAPGPAPWPPPVPAPFSSPTRSQRACFP